MDVKILQDKDKKAFSQVFLCLRLLDKILPTFWRDLHQKVHQKNEKAVP